MKTKNLIFFLVAIIPIFFSSCLDEVKTERVEQEDTNLEIEEFLQLSSILNLPNEPLDYSLNLPVNFTRLGARAPTIDNNVATLGRVLFYDKKLSANNTVSCASCHSQERAFADPVAFSKGFDGELTKRNSFALGAVASIDATYYGSDGVGILPNGDTFFGSIFWDNRVRSIPDQARQTLTDPIEMGENLHNLTNELADQEYYKILFKRAFGTSEINEDLVLEALDEFIRSLVTSNSKFDKGMQAQPTTLEPNNPFSNFNSRENRGKEIYMEHCASCHGRTMITTIGSANNGLDLVYQDKGMGDLDQSGLTTSSLNGVFKVPLLRNVELTAPYMHDGRFATLREVVDHYNSGVKAHPNLDPKLRSFDGPLHLNLSNWDSDNLIMFLQTLTDESFITAEKYSDPFK